MITMEETKTFGRLVVESESFLRQLKDGGDSRGYIYVSVSTKDITGVSASAPGGLSMAGAQWSNALAVRGRLVPVGRTTAGAVTYVKETTPVNSNLTGVEVSIAEGAAKPESDADDWDAVTVTVKTFAITFKISRQSLEDLDYLAARIQQRYETALAIRIDNEIVMGTGLTVHLNGIYTQAPAAVSTGTTVEGAIGAAYGELAGKGFVPDGLVVHTSDLGRVLGAVGNNGMMNPQSGTAWGMRLGTITDSGLAGKFLIGAFAGNSLYLEREEVGSEIALEHVDDFIKNLATVKIEGRGVLVDLSPVAFLRGTLPA